MNGKFSTAMHRPALISWSKNETQNLVILITATCDKIKLIVRSLLRREKSILSYKK